MSSYVSTSSANTFTNDNEFSGNIISNTLIEKFTTGTVTSNTMSINMSTATNNVYSITPSSASNIALTITNLPTSRSAIYTFSFLINTSTNKQFINTLSVNGSSVTMKAGNGLSNVSINASASMVIQNIYIQMTGATVSNAFTTVLSCF